MDKKFLIIHPTADGKKTFGFFQFFNIFLFSVWHFVLRLIMFHSYSEIHLPAHQRKGQLHLTGTWRCSFHSAVITAAADPISALVFSSPRFSFSSNLWELGDPSGIPQQAED